MSPFEIFAPALYCNQAGVDDQLTIAVGHFSATAMCMERSPRLDGRTCRNATVGDFVDHAHARCNPIAGGDAVLDGVACAQPVTLYCGDAERWVSRCGVSICCAGTRASDAGAA